MKNAFFWFSFCGPDNLSRTCGIYILDTGATRVACANLIVRTNLPFRFTRCDVKVQSKEN